MAEKIIMVPVKLVVFDEDDVTVDKHGVKHGYMPSFHEQTGTFEEGPIESIGRGTFAPYTYYLWTREEGPNGRYAGHVNLVSMFQHIASNWETINGTSEEGQDDAGATGSGEGAPEGVAAAE